MTPEEAYDLKSVQLPYLSGMTLKAFVNALESPLGGALLIPNLLESAGINHLRQREITEDPINFPIHFCETPAKPGENVPESEWPQATQPTNGFQFASIWDYANAYREQSASPEEIAQGVLNAMQDSDSQKPPLRAMLSVQAQDVLRQARESAQRHQAGKPLSPLDGVPVAVKDEVDMIPHPTTVGTSFLGHAPASRDATVVARLRAAGALLIGKANMHEIGIGVTGLNPHHGTPRNPYNPAHYTGGSSSGSAAAVAAGLCPLAIGADGGGSIRIPAAFCGLVGLKATYGRVSEFGAFPLDWSIAHIGPIAASAADAALGYALIAGPDPLDPNSLHQPRPSLAGWQNTDLRGLKIGVFWPWFRHASAEVVEACEALLRQFLGLGAGLREIVLPDLSAGRVAHVITIAGEMAQAMEAYHKEHHRQHGLDVRLNLTLARAFTLRDYVKAQRVRARLMHHFQKAFEQVDVILTPMSGIAAPPIPATALPDGDSDLTTLTEMMRFATPANLTGLPAITFPAGYTQKGLPIGLQAIGRPWDEVTLLRLALAAEGLVERKAPQVYYKIF